MLEILVLLGDLGTAERLRTERLPDASWSPPLELALFRTGEEIAARAWETNGEGTGHV